jgi:hypothetical protein
MIEADISTKTSETTCLNSHCHNPEDQKLDPSVNVEANLI